MRGRRAAAAVALALTVGGCASLTGWIDVSAIQNTYRPSYPDGKVYWQTSTSYGTTYTSTGCGSPSHQPPPAPVAPLTGSCPTD